jgi:hypothetical protein
MTILLLGLLNLSHPLHIPHYKLHCIGTGDHLLVESLFSEIESELTVPYSLRQREARRPS